MDQNYRTTSNRFHSNFYAQSQTPIQMFYKTQSLKLNQKYNGNIKKYNSTAIEFQLRRPRAKSSQKSLSCKQNIFKSAKKLQTNEKPRSSSNKKLITQPTENDNKKFVTPLKDNNKDGGKVNDKKVVQQIMNRLRNKNSIKINLRNKSENQVQQVKRLELINECEPQLKLKEKVRNQITGNNNKKQIIETVDPQVQKRKMINLFEEKSSHFEKIESQIGKKMNQMQGMMQEFRHKEKILNEKQKFILKKEKQIDEKLSQVIKKKNKPYKHQLKEKQQPSSIIQNQQKPQAQIKNQENQHKQSEIAIMIQSMPDSTIKKPIKTQNNHIKEDYSKIPSKKQDYFTADHVDIQEIDQISLTNNKKDEKSNNKTDEKHKIKLENDDINQRNPSLSNHKISKPPVLAKNTLPSHNQKNVQKPNQQKAQISFRKDSQENVRKSVNQEIQLQEIIVDKQIKQDPKVEQSKKVRKQSQKIASSNVQKEQAQMKKKQQKEKMVQFFKKINRQIELIYFIGEIPHHCSNHMKKNKKYSFKLPTLYLLKYVYDKFRYIEQVFGQLLKKKFVTKENYSQRVQQNQTIKETYIKMKAYAYKRDPLPPKDCEKYLDEQSSDFCFQEKSFMNKFIFQEIRKTIEFYREDTGGKWSDHKVNLCYYRMLLAVFILEEIQFDFMVIQSEYQEVPDYMLSEIDKFTENQLRDKMSQSYQIFMDLEFQ